MMRKLIRKQLSWQVASMHALFGVFFVMAFYLYKERLFVDCGYYIFYAINDQFFRVDHHRYVLAISQLLPLIGMYAGAGLKSILITYSLSHVLFYYVLFLIVEYRFNDLGAGAAILLIQTIGQLYLYFSPMLEICYGAGLLIPFYVLLNRTDRNRWHWFWLIFLEFMILTSHPENFIIFFFVVAMHMLQNGFQRKLHPTLVVLFFVLMIIKIFSFSEYESNKVNYMMKQDENKLYQNFFSPDYVKGILHVLYAYFWELVVFFFITAVVLLKEKKWKQFLLFVSTVVGTIVLINVTNYANEFSRYRESLYNPLVPVIVIGFIHFFYNHISSLWKKVAFVLLLCMIVNRIFLIYEYSKPFTQRIAQMENIILHARQNVGSKFMVNLENCERKNWQLNWSYPLETIMLSSLEKGSKTICVATDEDMQNIKASLPVNEQTSIITRWDIRYDTSFNNTYFNLEHGNYIALTTTDTLVNSETYDGNIFLTAPKTLLLEKNNVVYVPVNMINSSGAPLYSGKGNAIFLTYHWIEKNSGGMRKGIRTPLEVDVTGEYRQVMEVKTPDESGEYLLVVDLVIHDRRLNINAGSEVEIY